jgi:hypothetical protein
MISGKGNLWSNETRMPVHHLESIASICLHRGVINSGPPTATFLPFLTWSAKTP